MIDEIVLKENQVILIIIYGKKESPLSAHSDTKTSSWFKRILILLVFLELIYLLVFNVLLNSSYLKERVNASSSKQLQIEWGSAWTFYPTRIHVDKMKIEGTGGSKIWQADIGSASASFSLLSLMGHKVEVCNVEINDVAYTEKSDTSSQQAMDASASEDSTAEVSQDGNMSSNEQEGEQEKSSWPVVLKGIRISGKHSIESEQLKAQLSGGIKTDLHIDTEKHSLQVDNGTVNIVIDALQSNRGEKIVQDAKVSVAFKISPLDYKSERKGRLLEHVTLDSAVAAQLNDLKVFSTQLQRTRGIKLDGKGKLEGNIHLKNGKLLQGSKVLVAAERLQLKRDAYMAKGDGKIEWLVSDKRPDVLEGRIEFGDYRAYRSEALHAGKVVALLFQGKGLTLTTESSATLYPKKAGAFPIQTLGLVLPPVVIHDLTLLQQYVPEKWQLVLKKGEGKVEARARIDENELNATIKLGSKGAEIDLGEQRLLSDLDLKIGLKIAAKPSLHADLTGTSIVLANTKLLSQKGSEKRESKVWNTTVAVEKGIVELPLSGIKSGTALPKILKSHKPKELFAGANGELKLTGKISRLDWVNQLAKSSLGFSLSGKGVIDGTLLLQEGKVQPKTMLKILSDTLEVGLLDYLFDGDGSLIIEKTDSEKTPLLYALAYKNATLKHKNEEDAMIEGVVMRLERAAGDASVEGSVWDKPLHLQILSAKVKSVTLFNRYFPENSPVSFVGGGANLTSDITLEANDAKGYIKLVSEGLTMNVNEQNISARLSVDTKIVSGEPRKMLFDISGSKILLDQANVVGKKRAHSDDDWSLEIDLKKAEVIWKKPLWLRSQTVLTMKDSRPIVAMIENGNSQLAFISKMLIVDNLKGEARIDMENNAIRIPFAMVKSEKVDIGAKALIGSKRRDGVILVKHKNFRVLLKMEGDRKSFDLFTAEKSFDSYEVPELSSREQ